MIDSEITKGLKELFNSEVWDDWIGYLYYTKEKERANRARFVRDLVNE